MESCLENCLEPGARGKEAAVSAGAAAVPGVPGHPVETGVPAMRGNRARGRLWRVLSLFRQSQH